MAELVLLSLVDQANCRCELKSLDGEVLGVVCLSREALGKVFTEQADAIEWDGVVRELREQMVEKDRQDIAIRHRGDGWEAYLREVSRSSVRKRMIGGRDCLKRTSLKSETWNDVIRRASSAIRSADKNERNRAKDEWTKYINNAVGNGHRRSRWQAALSERTKATA